ncbi:hypothetical protein FA048_12655 [Pedobacter polaris]|uniref:RepB family plasmid replication initiator protein n=1 Tax=Pedobacter polaris TaxID=2571273 RepID=A0A4U1CN55_9SPHI|nr:hypothetical protein [Pedobacter polaris]TKC08008.1 hypothetical protein FA048_12655 [Pedobacter polaris]
MDNKTISRIDRAVADNLKDIERSFDSHSGLVQDFIVFITKQIKFDLFGYTRFTMLDFCKATGRHRQDLAIKHPIFKNTKIKVPIIQGYKFETVFDYALYLMLERNIIFSRKYEYKEGEEVIHMKNFPILIDLKLNFDRKKNELKQYEVRVSNELLDGFLRRYYNINTEIYKKVGKGKGGETRQSLLLYLFKMNHILLTTNNENSNSVIVPLDRLCDYASIQSQLPKHKKLSLTRVLQKIQESEFKFIFEFVGKSNYMVKLTFNHLQGQKELLADHSFYNRLMINLKYVFRAEFTEMATDDNPAPFQNWLANNEYHLEDKAKVLADAYLQCLNLKITKAFAIELILSGDILIAKN